MICMGYEVAPEIDQVESVEFFIFWGSFQHAPPSSFFHAVLDLPLLIRSKKLFKYYSFHHTHFDFQICRAGLTFPNPQLDSFTVSQTLHPLAADHQIQSIALDHSCTPPRIPNQFILSARKNIGPSWSMGGGGSTRFRFQSFVISDSSPNKYLRERAHMLSNCSVCLISFGSDGFRDE